MLIDANLVLYAVDSSSPDHTAAAQWWERVLNGTERVALPWQTIGAFLRIITHPRITRRPLSATQAWEFVESWLAAPVTWVPSASERTATILGALLGETRATGNLVPDAQLAALAMEHGLEVMSADTDFARFPDVRWTNPLR